MEGVGVVHSSRRYRGRQLLLKTAAGSACPSVADGMGGECICHGTKSSAATGDDDRFLHAPLTESRARKGEKYGRKYKVVKSEGQRMVRDVSERGRQDFLQGLAASEYSPPRRQALCLCFVHWLTPFHVNAFCLTINFIQSVEWSNSGLHHGSLCDTKSRISESSQPTYRLHNRLAAVYPYLLNHHLPDFIRLTRVAIDTVD